jgi:hypothetical protein
MFGRSISLVPEIVHIHVSLFAQIVKLPPEIIPVPPQLIPFAFSFREVC